jgi:hypothetical protein
MTRERSTWNINNIAKQAGLKVADPYTMNQDHKQPAADAYVTGDPSTFAEDIHPAAGTWEAEYSGGQVKRNEIGMPEMRNDTFNHPEKTASDEVLVKKAAVCVALARSVLPKTASPMDVEEQSISFMHLPDEELMSTFTRLAAKQDQDQQQEQQVQAAKQDQQGQQQVQAAKQDQQQGQQQQVQAAKQDQQQQGQQQEQQVQAAQQDQQDQQGQQQVQASQNFTDPRHTSVRALLAQDQQDQGQQAQQEQKQAGQEQQAQMQQQLAQMIQQAQQQLENLQAQAQQQQQAQQVQAPPAQQQGGQQAGQQQQAQMQQQGQAQQVAQAVQQAIQQGQDPVAAAAQCMAQYQQQGQSQQQGNDGELIDQMLAQQQTQQPMANMDIELDTPTMDVGEVQLGPEDDMLMQLFANEETQQAQQAQDGGQQQQKQAHAVRTASMRTVGTVPSQGVSRIGGTSTAKVASGGDQLSSLWSSAPDVRDAFGIPSNQ